MYTDINGQNYKLLANKAIIQPNSKSCKIEIFSTITIGNRIYEVAFPDDCYELFSNVNLEEFTLHKLLNPTTNITSTKGMFDQCKNLKRLDLTNLNTENVVNMESMFCNCFRLEDGGLNVSSFNTSNVENMKLMFIYVNLNKVDLSNFNTENVRNMELMFRYITCEYLDLSNFNTENVSNMRSMFHCCDFKKINLSSFTIDHYPQCNEMFHYILNVEELDLHNFKFYPYTVSTIFQYCGDLKYIDISCALLNRYELSEMRYYNNKLTIVKVERNKEILTFPSIVTKCDSFENINLESVSIHNIEWFYYDCEFLNTILAVNTIGLLKNGLYILNGKKYIKQMEFKNIMSINNASILYYYFKDNKTPISNIILSNIDFKHEFTLYDVNCNNTYI